MTATTSPNAHRLDTLRAALDYFTRGWQSIPIPRKSKNPNRLGWQNERRDEAAIQRDFITGGNIGVLLGQPSGGLVDVDLDHELAVAMADDFLPATSAVFGRPGKARSHRLYQVNAPTETLQLKVGVNGRAMTVVELRTTGLQTVFPPSIHPSGEEIAWEAGAGEPAIIAPGELRAAVERLHAAVLEKLGAVVDQAHEAAPHQPTQTGDDRAQRALAAMLRIRTADGTDGSKRLYTAACRCVEWDLSDNEAVAAVRSYAGVRPFPTQWTDKQILDRVRAAEKKATRGKSLQRTNHGPAKKEGDESRGIIVVGTDEDRVIDEAIAAIAQDKTIFQRGGLLVHVVRDTEPPRGLMRPKDAPRVAPIRLARLRELAAKSAQWLRPAGDDKLERCHPPDWAVKAIDARGEWPGIRRLEGVVQVPILRADGSILQTPGYDSQTGLILEAQAEFPEIPAKLTRDDAIRARDALLETVVDFPFTNDRHRAAWLTAAITPSARFAFNGPAPLNLTDANVRGSGKTLLNDVIGCIHTGRPMARMAQPHDDDETRKQITAIALAGETIVLIDNVAGTLGCASLDAALTGTSWADRILGRSETVKLPLYTTWYATGNNVLLNGDTARRVLHIRLECLQEQPEERAGFQHGDLLAWVQQVRGRLATAAVILLSAYCQAGRPDMGLRPWGSFEAWSGLVRQAVVWAGLPDPGENRVELTRQADREAGALRQLLQAIEEADPHGHGLTVAEMLTMLGAHPTSYDGLRAALLELVPTRDGRLAGSRSIGMKLHHLRLRVVAGRYLDRRDSGAGAVWSVRGVPGTTGSSDTSTTPRMETKNENLIRGETSAISGGSPPDHWTREDRESYADFMAH